MCGVLRRSHCLVKSVDKYGEKLYNTYLSPLCMISQTPYIPDSAPYQELVAELKKPFPFLRENQRRLVGTLTAIFSLDNDKALEDLLSKGLSTELVFSNHHFSGSSNSPAPHNLASLALEVDAAQCLKLLVDKGLDIQVPFYHLTEQSNLAQSVQKSAVGCFHYLLQQHNNQLPTKDAAPENGEPHLLIQALYQSGRDSPTRSRVILAELLKTEYSWSVLTKPAHWLRRDSSMPVGNALEYMWRQDIEHSGAFPTLFEVLVDSCGDSPSRLRRIQDFLIDHNAGAQPTLQKPLQQLQLLIERHTLHTEVRKAKTVSPNKASPSTYKI